MGSFALTLDGKGRVAVPARHREVLNTLGATQLTITKHPHGSLMIFPPLAWESFSTQVGALPMEAVNWKRVFIGNAAEVELDASSRILVPPELRRFAGLERDVMMLGMLTHIELWDAQRYAELENGVVTGDMPDAVKKLSF